MRFLATISLLLFSAAALAQAPADAPQRPGVVDTPAQTNVPVNAPLNPKLPTIFIVGDSTARNGADLGWGDHIAKYFDTSRVNVANRAKAGRSSRTYINEGLWRDVLAEMKPGDFVLLQMGHNDGGDLGGAKPRGSLKGVGEETKDVPQTTGPLAGHTETVYTYGYYVRKYIVDARAKGATPILMTLTVRNIWKPGADGKLHIERDMGYSDYIWQVSLQKGAPQVDLTNVEADALEKIGPEETAKLFPKDHTHTSAEGAELVAKCVSEAIRKANVPVAQFLKP